MSTADNAALVRRWFDEIWNQGRVEALEELFDPAAIAHGLGEAGVEVRGPAGYRPFFEKLRAAFPELHITVEATVAEGDMVASRWVAEVTHAGDQLGVPATGRRVRVTGMSMARIAGGKIVEGWNNWDQLTLLEAVGASPRRVTLLEPDIVPEQFRASDA